MIDDLVLDAVFGLVDLMRIADMAVRFEHRNLALVIDAHIGHDNICRCHLFGMGEGIFEHMRNGFGERDKTHITGEIFAHHLLEGTVIIERSRFGFLTAPGFLDVLHEEGLDAVLYGQLLI